MVVAIPMLFARMILQPMPLNVLARLDIPIRAQVQLPYAQVVFTDVNEFFCTKCFLKWISDSCKVNNGGCGMNAICSHDAKTNEVECDCLTGYTNTGSGSTFTCTGNCS